MLCSFHFVTYREEDNNVEIVKSYYIKLTLFVKKTSLK